MNFTTIHHQIALTLLSGIGSRRARLIIGHFNGLDEFFTEKKINLSKLPGIPVDYVSLKVRMQALIAADKIYQEILRSDAQTVFFTEKAYPERLKHCDDSPLLLYAKGNINWNPEKVVSIVGTRHATDYGKGLTEELIAGLKSHNVTIVSGMAYGIDICAHKMALKYDLPTWGVLGHGIELMYPHDHRKTAQRMLDEGGLISEFYPSQKPEPQHFPMRNRIVAGISDATIVIESGSKGGSLITAQMAFDYNKEVCAYPGDVTRPYSQGCLDLIIQQKATLIRNSSDFIKHMSWDTPKPAQTQRSLFVDLSPIENKVVDALKTKPELSLDAIGYLTSLSVAETSTQLLSLEFKGLVRSLPGRRYQLV